MGALYEIELLEENADAFLFGERGRFPPQGVAGGDPGALNRFQYEQFDGLQEPPMKSKMVGIKIKRGQHLRLETPGGGGFGPAWERDPTAVAEDVRLGYVTTDAAKKNYGVVVDAEGQLDAKATKDLRMGSVS